MGRGIIMKKVIIILFILVLACIQDDGKSIHEGVQIHWTKNETLYMKGNWFDIDKTERNRIVDSLYKKYKK